MNAGLERIKKRAYVLLENKENILSVILHTREEREYNEIPDVFNLIKLTV